MTKISHPFSNPFGKKEGDDRPRRTRQGRFFEHDRNAPATKFEKLHEVSGEKSDALKPPVDYGYANATVQAALRAIVSGRVQMVMYRDFVQRKAKSLGIVGTVRNMPDGTVEVVAGGRKETLDEFLQALATGPVLARVEHVAVEWIEPSGAFSDFSIV